MAIHIAKYGKTAAGSNWRAEVNVKGFKRKYRTFPTKKEATEWAREEETALSRSKHDAAALSHKYTVHDAIERYIAKGMTKKSESTIRGDLPRLREWDELLGGVRLDELTATGIYLMLEDQPVSGQTKNNKLGILSAVMTFISKAPNQWIKTNPCREVERWEGSNRRERVLTKREWELLITTAEEWAKEARASDVGRTRLPLFLRLLYQTGCRRSEGLRLKVTDIKWDRPNADGDCIAMITGKARDKNKKPVIRPTVLTREILDGIEFINRASDFVFEGRYGTPPSFDNSLKELKKLLPETMQDVGFHTLRHTAMTEMGRKGASLHDLQVFGGHKTLSMVARYLHSDEDDAWRVLSTR